MSAEEQQVTKQVTKQKDPKRVAMGRQLGLRSKEYKLKKQEMMKSGKQDSEVEEPKSSNESLASPVITAGEVVLGLGLGYFINTKFKSSLSIPTLTPAIIEQRDFFEERQKEASSLSPAKIVIPTTPKIATGVIDIE